MKKILLVCCFGAAFILVPDSRARLTKPWRYQEMFDRADLVVIARVVTTKDTSERSTILGLDVIGVTTDFRTHLILKGDKSIASFQLHHYRVASVAADASLANGPNFIRFSFEHPAFLLFLNKADDGRYVPVTGQEDPGAFSVLELTGGAD
jgi:hypothetical protein